MAEPAIELNGPDAYLEISETVETAGDLHDAALEIELQPTEETLEGFVGDKTTLSHSKNQELRIQLDSLQMRRADIENA